MISTSPAPNHEQIGPYNPHWRAVDFALKESETRSSLVSLSLSPTSLPFSEDYARELVGRLLKEVHLEKEKRGEERERNEEIILRVVIESGAEPTFGSRKEEKLDLSPYSTEQLTWKRREKGKREKEREKKSRVSPSVSRLQRSEDFPTHSSWPMGSTKRDGEERATREESEDYYQRSLYFYRPRWRSWEERKREREPSPSLSTSQPVPSSTWWELPTQRRESDNLGRYGREREEGSRRSLSLSSSLSVFPPKHYVQPIDSGRKGQEYAPAAAFLRSYDPQSREVREAERCLSPARREKGSLSSSYRADNRSAFFSFKRDRSEMLLQPRNRYEEEATWREEETEREKKREENYCLYSRGQSLSPSLSDFSRLSQRQQELQGSDSSSSSGQEESLASFVSSSQRRAALGSEEWSDSASSSSGSREEEGEGKAAEETKKASLHNPSASSSFSSSLSLSSLFSSSASLQKGGKKVEGQRCPVKGCVPLFFDQTGQCSIHAQPQMVAIRGNSTGSSSSQRGSKRNTPRRRCKVKGCPKQCQNNGVCIAHGASVKRCSAEGCTKYALTGGVCISHGAKVRRCKVEGCLKHAQVRGVCVGHGAQLKRCKIPGCKSQARKQGKCRAHRDVEL